MKMLSWTPIVTLIAVCVSVSSSFGQVSLGDTQEEVLAALGEPTGFVEVNGREAYTFPRGHVVFRDGRVISHRILSQEEAQSRQEAAERQREDRREEGLALRDQMQSDEDLANASPRERLAVWEVFHQKYPEIDVTLEYSLAARQVQAEEEEARQEMELRVAEAERMAEVTQQNQPQLAQQYWGSGFPLLFDDGFRPSPKARDRTAKGAGFQARQPAPMPPTGRESMMPLQTYPQEFGQRGHRGKAHHSHRQGR